MISIICNILEAAAGNQNMSVSTSCRKSASGAVLQDAASIRDKIK